MGPPVDLFDEASHDVEYIAQQIDLVNFSEAELGHQWNEVIEDQAGSFLFNTDALGHLGVLFFHSAQVDLC